MATMIAVRTVSGYRAARVEFGFGEIFETLRYNWGQQMAMHSLVAGGDMMSIGRMGAMRAVNSKPTRHADTLFELIKHASAEGVHKTIVYDETDRTFDAYSDWNMTCEPGEDLFIENIADAGPWFLIYDADMVEEIFNRKAA